jgi:hypothetical protein
MLCWLIAHILKQALVAVCAALQLMVNSKLCYVKMFSSVSVYCVCVLCMKYMDKCMSYLHVSSMKLWNTSEILYCDSTLEAVRPI